MECIKKGAFHFLEKPVEIDELVDKVEEAAHRNRRNQNEVISIRSMLTRPSQETIDSLDRFVRRALGYESDE